MTDRTWAEDLSPAVNVAVNSWTDDGGADTPTWTTGYAGGMQFDHVTRTNALEQAFDVRIAQPDASL